MGEHSSTHNNMQETEKMPGEGKEEGTGEDRGNLQTSEQGRYLWKERGKEGREEDCTGRTSDAVQL